jgi:hypothetical protein
VTNAIQVENLAKRYGTTVALDAIDPSLWAGSVLAYPAPRVPGVHAGADPRDPDPTGRRARKRARLRRRIQPGRGPGPHRSDRPARTVGDWFTRLENMILVDRIPKISTGASVRR